MNNSNKLNNLTKEEFALLYDSMSQKRLAMRLKTTVNNVMNYRNAYQLPEKPKGRPTNDGYRFRNDDTFKPEVQTILDKYDKAVS